MTKQWSVSNEETDFDALLVGYDCENCFCFKDYCRTLKYDCSLITRSGALLCCKLKCETVTSKRVNETFYTNCFITY